MGRYAINFAITVLVNDPDINIDECGDDISHELSDKEYNKLFDAAVNAIDTSDLSGNVTSIERID